MILIHMAPPASRNVVIHDNHGIAETPPAVQLHQVCSQMKGIIPQDKVGHVSVIVRQQVIIKELDGFHIFNACLQF